jgi:hypothetical protein
LEKLNKILNELSKNEEYNEKKDFLFLLNNLIDHLLENKENKDIEFLLKKKISSNITLDLKNFESKIKKLIFLINKQFLQELEIINKNIDILILNQRKINEFKLSLNLRDEKITKILKKIEMLNKKQGSAIINEYLKLINKFEEKKKDLNNKLEIFLKDPKKDLYTLKLFLYQLYFDLKLLDELIKEKKLKIIGVIEKINSEMAYFERMLEKEIEKIKRTEINEIELF